MILILWERIFTPAAAVLDSFTTRYWQRAILAFLTQQIGVFLGLLPGVVLRRSEIKNLYGFRVKVCTRRKAVIQKLKPRNTKLTVLIIETTEYAEKLRINAF